MNWLRRLWYRARGDTLRAEKKHAEFEHYVGAVKALQQQLADDLGLDAHDLEATPEERIALMDKEVSVITARLLGRRLSGDRDE